MSRTFVAICVALLALVGFAAASIDDELFGQVNTETTFIDDEFDDVLLGNPDVEEAGYVAHPPTTVSGCARAARCAHAARAADRAWHCDRFATGQWWGHGAMLGSWPEPGYWCMAPPPGLGGHPSAADD